MNDKAPAVIDPKAWADVQRPVKLYPEEPLDKDSVQNKDRHAKTSIGFGGSRNPLRKTKGCKSELDLRVSLVRLPVLEDAGLVQLFSMPKSGTKSSRKQRILMDSRFRREPGRFAAVGKAVAKRPSVSMPFHGRRGDHPVRTAVVAGARPNFVKVAPLIRELTDRGHRPAFLHTGQHYDSAMSESLFADLELRAPDANFGVGSGSHGVQTARVMERFDSWLDDNSVDAVVVVGDVNSSVACALVAAKRKIPVAHVEAGLRSFDRSMPEEINRLVTDVLCDWLLTPSPDADANLLAEGVDPARIFRVDNIMADSLFQAIERSTDSRVLDRVGIRGPYAVVTLHSSATQSESSIMR